MFKNNSRAVSIGVWLAAVVVMMAGTVVTGVQITRSTAELWLIIGLVPPAVLLLLWRGAPPATVAEVLHTVHVAPSDRLP
jgi:hypothetical protein